MMPRPGASAGIVALLLAVALLGCSGSDGNVQPLRIGDRTPEFTLPALDGGVVSSSSLVGKPVVLNFWATWCEPCRHELPVLNELARDSRIQVIAIALDEEGEKSVRPFAEKHGLSYTILLGDQATFERFSGLAIPFTLVLDEAGKIVNYYRGPAPQEKLVQDLETIHGAGPARS